MIQCGLLWVPYLEDLAAERIRTLMQEIGPTVLVNEEAVAGERAVIEEILRRWCDEKELDLILTVGGTLPAPGPGRREATPEATLAIVERPLPGFGESMRAVASEENPLSNLDRGISGIRGRTLIINLPAGALSSALFLDAVVDLIEPVILHLREDDAAPQLDDGLEMDDDATVPAVGDSDFSTGLDADEFARYLERKRAPHRPDQ